jgi:hypothetical protein
MYISMGFAKTVLLVIKYKFLVREKKDADSILLAIKMEMQRVN